MKIKNIFEKAAASVGAFFRKHPADLSMLVNWSIILLWLFILMIVEFGSLYLAGVNQTFWNPFLQALFFYLFLSAVPLFTGKYLARVYTAVMLSFSTVFLVCSAVLSFRFRVEFDGDAIPVLMATSVREIREFVWEYFSWITLSGIFLLILITGCGIVFLCRRKWSVTRYTVLLGIILCVPWILSGVRYISMNEQHKIFRKNSILRLVFGYLKFNREFGALINMAESPVFPDAPLKFSSHKVRNLAGIIVIGESACRNHMGIYGYPRDTTPELRKLSGELCIYRDVISSYSSTTWAMRYLMTQSEIGEKKQRSLCSLTQLLKHAGFRVEHYSNQYRWGNFDGPVTMLFAGADSSTFISEVLPGCFDDAMIPSAEKALNKDNGKPVVIFLHLIGSHTDPASRYPETWKPFTGVTDRCNAHLKKKYAEHLNAYDNSIAFTDKILGDLIRLLKKSERPSFLLYVSDHGNIIDTGKNQLRSGSSVEHDAYEIPFVLWLSPEYKADFPGFAVSAANNVNQPLQTDHAFWGMVELAQISFDGFPHSRSIFSYAYRPARQRFLRDGQVLYEKKENTPSIDKTPSTEKQ